MRSLESWAGTKPEQLWPGATTARLPLPEGSGNLSLLKTGHSNPGFAGAVPADSHDGELNVPVLQPGRDVRESCFCT